MTDYQPISSAVIWETQIQRLSRTSWPCFQVL